jgi:hypothetical protein
VLCSALICSLLMVNLHAKREQCNLLKVDETGKAAGAELQLQLCSPQLPDDHKAAAS